MVSEPRGITFIDLLARLSHEDPQGHAMLDTPATRPPGMAALAAMDSRYNAVTINLSIDELTGDRRDH
jgi:hypothetical protein